MIERDGRRRKFRVWYDGFRHQDSGNYCTFQRGHMEVTLLPEEVRQRAEIAQS